MPSKRVKEIADYRRLNNEYHANLASEDPSLAVAEYIGYLRRYTRTNVQKGVSLYGEGIVPSIYQEFCRAERRGR